MSNSKNEILNKSTLEQIVKYQKIADQISNSIPPETYERIQMINEMVENANLTIQPHLKNAMKNISEVYSAIYPSLKNAIDVVNNIHSLIYPKYSELFEMGDKIQLMIPNGEMELEENLYNLSKEFSKELPKKSNENINNKNFIDDEISKLYINAIEEQDIEFAQELIFQNPMEKMREMESADEFRDIYIEYPELKVNSYDKEKIVLIKKALLIALLFIVILSSYDKYFDKIIMLFTAYDTLKNKLINEEA